MMKKYDDDKSGSLDLEEFRHLLADARKTQQQNGGTGGGGSSADRKAVKDARELVKNFHEWSPERVFAGIDLDGGGSLDLEELTVASTAVMGRYVPPEEVVELMKKYDDDNSGSLDIQEFKSLLLDARKEQAEKKSKNFMAGRADRRAVRNARAVVGNNEHGKERGEVGGGAEVGFRRDSVQSDYRRASAAGIRTSSVSGGRESTAADAPLRGKYVSVTRLTEIKRNKLTRMETLTAMRLGGFLPDALVKNLIIPQALIRCAEAAQFFSNLKPKDECSADDGKATGMHLMDKMYQHRGRHSTPLIVGRFSFQNRMLREINEEYPWFNTMMVAVLNNKLRPAKHMVKPLNKMTNNDSKLMGTCLAASLAINLTGEAAVDEWVLRFPALGQLSEQNEWFTPMLDAIARRLLQEVAWGLKLRVATGAAVSMADYTSDFIMITFYLSEDGGGWYAAGIITMIVGGWILHFILAWYQHGAAGEKRAMYWNMFLVVVGAKPAVDAYRVASSAEQREHQLADPTMELFVSKIIEIGAESVPAAILQTYYMLRNENFSGAGGHAAFFSIAMSAMCSGFTAAIIAFDFDVSPIKRRYNSEFYGFVPDAPSARSIVATVLIIWCATTCFLRCTAIALLLVSNQPFGFIVFFGYAFVDFLIYFTIKNVSGDTHYWMPIESRAEKPLTYLVFFANK